jgi:hypothetical protein
MTDDQRYNELMAACWSTQNELDQEAQAVEAAVRFYDRVPDGDARRPEAVKRLHRALDRRNVAERAAGAATDALIAYEAEHGTPAPTWQQLPLEDGL